MKRNYAAVLFLTALISLAGCRLFEHKQASATNPLLGNWKIDSIAIGQDSFALGYLLLAMSINDSAAYDYHFDKDTVTFYSKDSIPLKAPYSYIDSSHQLVIKDSSMDTFVVHRQSDSITGLRGWDSSMIYLRKR